jgi:hypothetical protein
VEASVSYGIKIAWQYDLALVDEYSKTFITNRIDQIENGFRSQSVARASGGRRLLRQEAAKGAQSGVDITLCGAGDFVLRQIAERVSHGIKTQ